MYEINNARESNNCRKKFDLTPNSTLNSTLEGKVLRLSELNPNHPSLKLHKLKGKLSGKYSVSITMSYRIILTFAVTEKGIVLIDIGSHEIYEK